MTRPVHLRKLLLTAASLLCASWAGAMDQPPQDPLTHWRTHIEAARLKTVPPPAKGVRETRWNELSPPGWNPGKILQRLGVAEVDDGDPGAKDVQAEIRREWDNAPTVPPPDDAPIRLTGFPVLLENSGGLAKSIILVPYYGAGIHRPSPPANQMVMVYFKHGLPRNLGQSPIWISGRMYPLAASTAHGRVGYTMPDAKWQKFPVDKYPLPQYIPLR